MSFSQFTHSNKSFPYPFYYSMNMCDCNEKKNEKFNYSYPNNSQPFPSPDKFPEDSFGEFKFDRIPVKNNIHGNSSKRNKKNKTTDKRNKYMNSGKRYENVDLFRLFNDELNNEEKQKSKSNEEKNVMNNMWDTLLANNLRNENNKNNKYNTPDTSFFEKLSLNQKTGKSKNDTYVPSNTNNKKKYEKGNKEKNKRDMNQMSFDDSSENTGKYYYKLEDEISCPFLDAKLQKHPVPKKEKLTKEFNKNKDSTSKVKVDEFIISTPYSKKKITTKTYTSKNKTFTLSITEDLNVDN